jgi:hypothetical protein
VVCGFAWLTLASTPAGASLLRRLAALGVAVCLPPFATAKHIHGRQGIFETLQGWPQAAFVSSYLHTSIVMV